LDPAEIGQLIGELEERVERLRALYDQYFMGIERLEPLTLRKEVDRRLWTLRREQIRNTGMRFKLETTIQRYNTYQQYWQRIVREIENGTYQRDLGRAAQRFGENAVTAFAKRRQKMFEKGVAKKAERDALRRSRSSAPPPPDEQPPSESYDVDFDDSEMLADPAPPLTLDFASSAPPPPVPPPAAPPSRALPPRPAGPAPPPRPPLPSAPGTSAPRAPVAPARRPMLEAVSPGTMREPTAPAPVPKPAAPPPHPLAPSQPEVPPARPQAASKPDVRPPAPRQADDALSQARLRQIYGQYVEAKRKANESTAAITFEKVAANLRETATQLRAKGKRSVDFEVVLKDGKPVLKPVVKG
jgi:hypothetical protein